MDARVKPAHDGQVDQIDWNRCSGEVIMEIVVTAIVALVIGVLAGSIAGFRFADYLNDRQKLKLLGVDTDLGEGHPVADRADGPVLRSARHCLDGRGFSEAVIPTLMPTPQIRGVGIGRDHGSRDRSGPMDDNVMNFMAHRAKTTAAVSEDASTSTRACQAGLDRAAWKPNLPAWRQRGEAGA